ncbi:hypothetical protein EDD80_1125 [Anseongella ginsenosidimutans]|uniref:Uncharacterized protein n=1 Tax=Anseongella ginsenosidimutans TaxID=496056 RepID=A0A4R3KMA5_9SPHI|nr:Ig-like domain-containing protein [Anseongella ginsenosidimutans]QEC52685.1 hypothetical protein FRZ59_10265 [Anseongella ginsenosidimutans]TCS85433.1 hypothetical protein EDD80_1125 [Anseongella ginsenosidimutans]
MKKLDILTTMVLLTLLASCKKSKEEMPEPANQTPKAALQIEGASGKLWNEVKVVVDASDTDGKIVSVDLYANNELIGSDAKAPYEFTWDTRKFPDGEVILKTVVTDEMDAASESEKKVEVMNTLIAYDLHARFLPMSPNYKYFTFITGEKGELLYFDQIESLPYKKAAMRPEEFNDERFDVHFTYANPMLGSITTFTKLSPGKFAPISTDKRGKKTGTSSMKFTNIPPHDRYNYANYVGKTLNKDYVYKVSIYENMDVGYLYLRQGKKGLYKIIEGLKDGGAVTSLSKTNFEMELHELTIAQKLDNVNVSVSGHLAPGPDAPAVTLFRDQQGLIPSYQTSYHLPHKAAVFDHFSHSISFSINHKIHYMESYANVISKPELLDLSAQLKSHKLSDIGISINGGPHDMVFSRYSVSNNGFEFSWACYSEDGNISFPKIPSELTKAFSKFTNANLVFAEADVNLLIRDYDHLKGYGDYIKARSGRTGKTVKEGGTYTVATMQQFLAP